MSSTDLDAPPLKLILAAIIIVVGLHVLTAVALVAIKTPEIKVEPKKDTPPIEIEMVTLPVKTVIPEVEKVQEVTPKKAAPKTESKPEPKKQAPSKPKVAPVVKAKQNTPEKPVVKAKKADIAPVVKVEKKKPDIIKKEVSKKPIVESKVDTSMADSQREAEERRKMLAAESQKAAQEAHDRAVQDAKRIADAKAAREAQAEANARKAAEDKAAKDAAQKAAAAASNEPVSFTAGDAEMIKTPRFSVPDSVLRRAKTGDTFNVLLKVTVDKQGRVSDVLLVGKSGNSIVDKEAVKKMHSARFRPFIKNGVPVVGVVTLPVSHVVD
ncbi:MULTISPECIES: energy transducer TonB [unclassified Psychrobacter]|uniref:energy transducer TonB n=1 Tax=unclassified Psychrobacter TaxID=196806 RepID=UPI00384D0E2F